jgi:hypothetical protein
MTKAQRVILQSPKGKAIIGTHERVYGTCSLQDARLDNQGSLILQQDGTDMDWNSQEPVLTEKGERLFVCEDGKCWAESELVRTPCA